MARCRGYFHLPVIYLPGWNPPCKLPPWAAQIREGTQGTESWAIPLCSQVCTKGSSTLEFNLAAPRDSPFGAKAKWLTCGHTGHQWQSQVWSSPCLIPVPCYSHYSLLCSQGWNQNRGVQQAWSNY